MKTVERKLVGVEQYETAHYEALLALPRIATALENLVKQNGNPNQLNDAEYKQLFGASRRYPNEE